MTNIDLLAGGDAHRRFDIHPEPGESLLQRVLALNDVERDGAQRAAQRALALPSAEGMPGPLRNALSRLAGGETPRPRKIARRSRNAD